MFFFGAQPAVAHRMNFLSTLIARPGKSKPAPKTAGGDKKHRKPEAAADDDADSGAAKDAEKEEKKERLRATLNIRRLFLILILFGIAIYAMNMSFKMKQGRGAAPGRSPFAWLQGMLGGKDRSRPQQLPALLDGAPEDLRVPPGLALSVARRLKAAGFRLYGVSRCRYTEDQRDMFGPRGSSARTVLESMYTECTPSSVCPGISVFPTWVHKGRSYPGIRDTTSLMIMVNEVEEEDDDGQQGGHDEADEEEEGGARRKGLSDAEKAEIAEAVYQRLKAEFSKCPVVARSKCPLAPAPEDEQEAGQDTEEEEEEAAAPVSAEEVEMKALRSRKAGLVEDVRGVSTYPNLNVPFMPGTEPEHLFGESYADFQARQGNVPRAAYQNREPTRDVAQQIVDSLQNLDGREYRVPLDPNESAYSEQRFPHSANITTGEGMDNKSVINLIPHQSNYKKNE